MHPGCTTHDFIVFSGVMKIMNSVNIVMLHNRRAQDTMLCLMFASCSTSSLGGNLVDGLPPAAHREEHSGKILSDNNMHNLTELVE